MHSTPANGMDANRLSPSEALARLSAPDPLSDAAVVRTRAVRFGFRIGSLGFLVEQGVLSELLRSPEIFPIPNVHSAIHGYVNLQGALVPVWNLHEVIGAADERAEAEAEQIESILVLGRGDRRVGVVIDGLPKSLKQLEPVKRAPPPLGVLDGYVQNAQVGDGHVWFEFDYDNFFRRQTERAGSG